MTVGPGEGGAAHERDTREPEVARPYFTRQAQYGRRVIFAWNPAASSPTNPLTAPCPLVEELIEGVAFADERAARRFDLNRAAGPSGRAVGGDVSGAGPWFEFLTWEEAEAWLRAGDTEDGR